MTIVEFLLARYAEDEEWADRHGCREDHRDLELGPSCAARVLAECEAKRHITKRAEMVLEAFDYGTHWTDVNRRERHHARAALEDLAAPYADHPDYDPAWRP